MHDRSWILLAAWFSLVLVVAPRAGAAAAVEVRVDNSLPDADGTATVAVTLHSNGNVVTAVQNDLLFDTRIVALANVASCTIGTEIGYTNPACKEDPPAGLCLTLPRGLDSCGNVPQPQGCEGQPPYVSRFRTIIFDYVALREIPDGAVLYTCKFDVVDRDALPALLRNTQVVAADASTERVDSVAADGYIGSYPPPTWTPAMPPTPAAIGDGCRWDGSCESGNCDWSRPRGDWPGRCDAPFTPTPAGRRCLSDDDCANGLLCNQEEGGVCCERLQCPAGLHCFVPGREGTCAALPTPTPTPRPVRSVSVYYRATEPDASGRFTVTARLDGDGMRSVISELVYDPCVFRAAGDRPCRINAEISHHHPDCELFPAPGPCLDLVTGRADAACIDGEINRASLRPGLLRLEVGTAITSGSDLFTCTFDVIDPALLPAAISISESGAYALDREPVEVSTRIEQGSSAIDAVLLTVQAAGPAAADQSGGGGCAIGSADDAGGAWLIMVATLIAGARAARRNPARARRP